MDTELTAITKPQRFEVFTGAGRRRQWSVEDKARIVAESVMAGESVCAVARRHGLTPQQLFSWRRAARQVTSEPEPPVQFAAVVVAAQPEEPKPRTSRRRVCATGTIELEIDGVVVRVGRGAEARTVAAVIRALKAGS